MAIYLLVYSQPRTGLDGAIAYEFTRLSAEHFDDESALEWACETVPRQKAAMLAGPAHLAKPIALWRVDGRQNRLIWERETNMAALIAA
jgi:hypothetical protein